LINYLKYLIFNTGPLATTGCDRGAFVNTRGEGRGRILQLQLPGARTHMRALPAACCNSQLLLCQSRSLLDLLTHAAHPVPCCWWLAGGSGDPDLQIRFVPGYALDPDAIKSYIKIGQLQETKQKWPAGEEWIDADTAVIEAAAQIPCQSRVGVVDGALHLISVVAQPQGGIWLEVDPRPLDKTCQAASSSHAWLPAQATLQA
jgi:hypothetical protein